MTEPIGVRDVGRLASFVDGVMIVSMTLLVLDVRLPDDVANLDGPRMLAALGALWPRYLAYVLSFLVIAKYWMGYTERFGALRQVDARFAWLNIAFLLVIGFIPFATAVLARNHGTVATMLYAGNMVLASLLLVVMWMYAVRRGLLDSISVASQRWRDVAPWLQVAAIFGASAAVTVYDPRVSKMMWLLLVLPSLKPDSTPQRS